MEKVFNLKMNRINSTLLFFLLVSISLKAYDPIGHRVVASLAQDHLKPEVKSKIDKILGVNGIIYGSSWADEIRSDEKYKETYQWHYQNLADNLTDEQIIDLWENPSREGEHLFLAIQNLSAKLKKSPTDAESLKLLIHFVGDLHQPMHLGRKEDLGGNKVKYNWFGRETNIHHVWDTEIIESKKMSYSELAQFLTDKFKGHKTKTNLMTSILISYSLRNEIYAYDYTQRNNYKYIYLFNEKIDERLFRGGLELAQILNDIYSTN